MDKPQETNSNLIAGSGKESQSRSRMGNESKTNGAASMAGGGGFRAKMEHYVYSGDKNHVMAGIGIFTLIFGIPWYLMNQGSKHQSHQDYMDKADKARKARLSSSNN